MPHRVPTLTVIAGPNGAGKSTLTKALRDNLGVPIIDPDAIARRLRPDAVEQAAVEAAREALQLRESYLVAGQGFAFETTLSGNAELRIMERARERGFAIHLVYVGIEDASMLADRIVQRVASGGHFVPEADVRRRYTRSMNNLPLALERCDHATIYDNTRAGGPRDIFIVDDGRVTMRTRDVPAWVTRRLGHLIDPSA